MGDKVFHANGCLVRVFQEKLDLKCLALSSNVHKINTHVENTANPRDLSVGCHA